MSRFNPYPTFFAVVTGANSPHFPITCKNEVCPTIFLDFGGVNKFGIISAIEEENRFYKTAKTFIMNKILLGLLAGVAIGLIVAPDKGSETLRKFREGFDDAKDKASDAAEDLWQKGSKAFRNAKSKFDEAV
jgi:hypothetical protein